MKKTLLLSLAALSSLMASGNLHKEVAVTAGYNKFDGASLMENAAFFGIRGTIYENEVNKYGLQVGYEGSSGVDYAQSGQTTSVHRFFTHLIADGEEEYNVVPYLLLGLGYEYLSDEIKGEPSQGFADAGIGFKYCIDEHFNLALETRAIGKLDTRDLDFNANLALGYMFGGERRDKFKPIVAFEKEKETTVPKSIVPKTTINVIHAPMVQPTPQIDEVTALVNEIDTNAKPIVTAQTSTNAVDATVVNSGDYYVQMAALASTPTQPLVQQLSDKGYLNTIVYPRDDANLVLVGPYSSHKEAQKAKAALKHIRRDAFIYRMQ